MRDQHEFFGADDLNIVTMPTLPNNLALDEGTVSSLVGDVDTVADTAKYIASNIEYLDSWRRSALIQTLFLFIFLSAIARLLYKLINTVKTLVKAVNTLSSEEGQGRREYKRLISS